MKNAIKIFTILIIMMSAVCSVEGAIWYSEGYNTFTDEDPQGEEVFVENDAVLNFLSGSAGLRVIHTATANIYGGIINDLYTGDSSITNIYLADLDILTSAHNSVVNLYAYDVTFFSTGGINDEGYMTGLFYQDNVSFAIDFWNPGTVSHVNIVPEPATLLLLGLGAVVLRRKS